MENLDLHEVKILRKLDRVLRDSRSVLEKIGLEPGDLHRSVRFTLKMHRDEIPKDDHRLIRRSVKLEIKNGS